MLKPAKIYSLVFIPPLEQYVVTLEDIKGTRLVPIWIGPNEGGSIALALGNEQFPRPMTHDLFINLLKAIGARVERVVITDVKDNTFYAVLTVVLGDKTFEMDSRPSDALALLARSNAQLFIDTRVLELCPVINKPISEEEIKKFKEELKNLRPEDFFKGLEGG